MFMDEVCWDDLFVVKVGGLLIGFGFGLVVYVDDGRQWEVLLFWFDSWLVDIDVVIFVVLGGYVWVEQDGVGIVD